MKNTILIASVFISSLSMATIKATNSLNNKELGLSKSATILIDENTNEACIVETTGLTTQGLNNCNEQEKAQAEQISALPKNPQFASLGTIIIGYYTTCSAIQFTPEIMNTVTDLLDKRSTLEKIKDSIAPNEERSLINDIRTNLQKVSETITGTICLPVGAANKKLIQIYKNN